MADELPDYYLTLQVDPTADPDVIQAAYRVLARKFHPDRAGDDSAMKALNAAWDALRDPDRRSRYDGARGKATQAAAPIPASDPSRAFVADHAGPPPGRPFGPVMTYGRYEGWSLGEIARVDREFLEWLRGVPAGRGFRDDIDLVIRELKAGRFATRRADGRAPEHKDYFKS